jgi:hypothetical protein
MPSKKRQFSGDRHHRGSASLTGGGGMGRLSPANGWRSPEERDKLELNGCGEFRLQQENAHGQVHRSGRAFVKLHAGGGEREREAAGDAGGGDERAVPDRGRAPDPAAAAHLPGGGDALGVAVRGAVAPRGEGRGGGGTRESRPEGRPAGCLRVGGGPPAGGDPAEGVQGAWWIRRPGLPREGVSVGPRRWGAGEID